MTDQPTLIELAALRAVLDEPEARLLDTEWSRFAVSGAGRELSVAAVRSLLSSGLLSAPPPDRGGLNLAVTDAGVRALDSHPTELDNRAPAELAEIRLLARLAHDALAFRDRSVGGDGRPSPAMAWWSSDSTDAGIRPLRRAIRLEHVSVCPDGLVELTDAGREALAGETILVDLAEAERRTRADHFISISLRVRGLSPVRGGGAAYGHLVRCWCGWRKGTNNGRRYADDDATDHLRAIADDTLLEIQRARLAG